MRLAATIIAIALILSALIFRDAMLNFKKSERILSVKGLAQKEMPADVAIFPLTIEVADNGYQNLTQKLKESLQKTLRFLESFGFSDDEITIAPPQIIDKLAEAYSSNVRIRYTASATLTIYTKKIDSVLRLQKELFRLSQQGVLVKVNSYDVEFLFTRLNEIKPQMIEIATQNAKKAALKFAKDAGARLGAVKSATQGYFSITNRDKNTPYIKRIRVVTKMQYYLE